MTAHSQNPKSVTRAITTEIETVRGRHLRGQQLDKYGRNLAAASLPGQGNRALHNTIQYDGSRYTITHGGGELPQW